MNKTVKRITPRYLYNSGLYYLQRYPASTHHFRTVMIRKIKRSCQAHPDQNMDDSIQDLEDVIEKFSDLGLLNDDLYTQGMVNSLRRSGKSKTAIMTKLRTKGLPDDLVLHHLNQYDKKRLDQTHSAEMEEALTFARKKKIGPYKIDNNTDKGAMDSQIVYKKSLAQMARAGFSYEICKTVLNFTEDKL